MRTKTTIGNQTTAKMKTEMRNENMAYTKECDETVADELRKLVGGTIELRESVGFESRAVILSLDVWEKIRYSKTYPHTFKDDGSTGLKHAYLTYVRSDGAMGEIKVILISPAGSGPNFVEVV